MNASNETKFDKDILRINPEAETQRICDFIRRIALQDFRRRGAVVGLSGGIDSALVVELAVRALGKEKVLGVFLPEKESNPISLEYAERQAGKLGIETVKVDITENLESFKVYQRRNAIIKKTMP